MMRPLEKVLRRKLEKTIKAASDTAEEAARAALKQLGAEKPAAYSHLTEAERILRRRLRAHGRQLGDARSGRGEQALDRLVEEVAYQHWHRMLFARFLAENDLLMYPDDPVAVTLEECEDLAADEGAANGWELAARYAARMRPQIFRPDSPVFQLALPPEYQQKLESLVADLPPDVFTASDSLGWVYQFWQAKRKDQVNKAEVKIGARELPAVTQLFTEPYMVSFLLDNSLGAWWAARWLNPVDLENAESEDELRRSASIPGVPLEYLRFVKVEAASSRLKEIGYFHKHATVSNLAGNLPHWRQENVTYFVTFRTEDSLPQEKINLWRRQREEWLSAHPEPHDEATKREFYLKFPERLQRWLDQGYGECLLARPEVRQIVVEALRFFDGERYDLDEYVVMPNHVHVLITPKKGHALSDILHSWKSFTAKAINRNTGKRGSFWQKESFDHIVRSPMQLEKFRQYIRDHAGYRSDKRQDAASTSTASFQNWLSELLAAAGHAGKTLETWLRDKFFSQHCKLFHQRPFIWHIWDGLRDGFAALINYHKFDAKLLETLIYTYLGDWIGRQKQDIENGVDGAREKRDAALALKKKFELILEGEAPYDIFVRWKPIEQQPIGWNPDLNDGVRLNIRPFMTVGDVKKKGAGVLRDKPNIKWNKDRGKDVPSAPWHPLFKGERIKDHHLTLAEKKAARNGGGAHAKA